MPETAVEHEFDELDVDDAPQVGIVMGSKSDMPLMEKAAKELEERGIRHEMRVMSGAPRPGHGGRLREERAHARAEGDHRRARASRPRCRAWWPRTRTCR